MSTTLLGHLMYGAGPTALTEALLSMDGHQMIITGGGGGGGGTLMSNVSFSCDVQITLNLMFLLFYCDKSHSIK